MTKTIVFETVTQAVLFVHEIRGQLSDGHWENRSPLNHWKPWCEAKVSVGPNVGRNFWPRTDRYNLLNRDLLEIVGHRMISYARLCNYFGVDCVQDMKYMLDLNGDFCGPPTFADCGRSTYWADIRSRCAQFDATLVKQVVEGTLTRCGDAAYNITDLRRDLRAMKVAMQTYNG